jgi:hypothetical protein
MITSERTSALWGALLAARKTFKPIVKDSQASIGPRQYLYADLAQVLDVVTPPLLEHGVIVLQAVDAETSSLVSRLVHAPTDQWIESRYPLNFDQAPQQLGSQVTYARRYQLQALLSIAAEDDDGASASSSAPRPFTGSRTDPVTPTLAEGAASTPSDDAPGGLEQARALVRDITQRTISNGGTKFTITTPDGTKYHTFKREAAELAKLARAHNTEIEITFRETKYGRELAAIRERSQAPDPPL